MVISGPVFEYQNRWHWPSFRISKTRYTALIPNTDFCTRYQYVSPSYKSCKHDGRHLYQLHKKSPFSLVPGEKGDDEKRY